MKDPDFRAFLVHRYVSTKGRSLTAATAGDCVSRVRRVEKLLKINIDELQLSEPMIDRLTEQLDHVSGSSRLTEFGLRDSRAALRRYMAFQAESQWDQRKD